MPVSIHTSAMILATACLCLVGPRSRCEARQAGLLSQAIFNQTILPSDDVPAFAGGGTPPSAPTAIATFSDPRATIVVTAYGTQELLIATNYNFEEQVTKAMVSVAVDRLILGETDGDENVELIVLAPDGRVYTSEIDVATGTVAPLIELTLLNFPMTDFPEGLGIGPADAGPTADVIAWATRFSQTLNQAVIRIARNTAGDGQTFQVTENTITLGGLPPPQGAVVGVGTDPATGRSLVALTSTEGRVGGVDDRGTLYSVDDSGNLVAMRNFSVPETDNRAILVDDLNSTGVVDTAALGLSLQNQAIVTIQQDLPGGGSATQSVVLPPLLFEFLVDLIEIPGPGGAPDHNPVLVALRSGQMDEIVPDGSGGHFAGGGAPVPTGVQSVAVLPGQPGVGNGSPIIITSNPPSDTLQFNATTTDPSGRTRLIPQVQIPIEGFSFRFGIPADIDRDGDKDMVIATGTSVTTQQNQPTGMVGGISLSPGPFSSTLSRFALAFDARDEPVPGSGNDKIAFAAQTQTGVEVKFSHAAAEPPTILNNTLPGNSNAGRVIIADVNNDGRDDIVAANTLGTGNGSGIDVFVNAGGGAFTTSTITGTTLGGFGSVRSVAVGDFNGDGAMDIASGGDPVRIGVLVNNGNGTTFNGTQVFLLPTSGQQCRDMTAADMNNDGMDDIVALIGRPSNDPTGATRQIAVYFGRPTGPAGEIVQTTPVTFTIGTSGGLVPRHLRVIDVNNDGQRDCLVTFSSGLAGEYQLATFLNRSTTTAGRGLTLDFDTLGVKSWLDGEPTGIEVADLDGLNGPEVIAGVFGGTLLNGFTILTNIRAPAPQSPCPGDADGDGTVDFGDVASVLANFGNIGAPGGPGANLGDADGDGDVDFGDVASVLANFGTNCL